MPGTLTIADINDLVIATRPREALGMLNDIASRLTEYCFVDYMRRENQITYDGGTSIRSNFIYDHNQSAAMVGLHEVIEPNIPDVLTRFDVPWRHLNYHWGYERREMLINAQGKTLQQINEIINTRRAAGQLSEAELLETQWWSNAADPANERDLWGLNYWLPLATTTRGFNIGAASGFTTVAGLDPDVYTRWKGYGSLFTDVSEDDLLEEMTIGMDQTGFITPMDIEEYKSGVGRGCKIFTNLNNKVALEKELRRRNDTHIMLGQFANATSFRNCPIKYVPKLNANTQDPLYMLNMDYIMIAGLAGDNDYEHEPMNDVKAPNTYIVHRDSTLQPVVTSRRRQCVFNKAA